MNILTICSVSYHSGDYLNTNRQLLKCSIPHKWVIIQNGPEEDLDESFEVYPGVPKPTERSKTIGTGSMHHAAALNHAIKSGYLDDSKYVLFLDPDFFIVDDLAVHLNYMRDYSINFYGAPYASEPTRKRIQNVPVAFCMFCNSHLTEELDFTPDLSVKDMWADTGYSIYKKIKKFNYDFAIPTGPPKSVGFTTHRSLNSVYNIQSGLRCDQYFLDKKLFGIHCHMKLHLREHNKNELKNRSKQQLREVKRIITKVREHDKIV